MKDNTINEILSQLPSSNKPIIKVLKKGTDSKTIVLGLKEGITLKEHKTNIPTTLLVIKGNVVYKEKYREINLESFDSLEIPTDFIHSVYSLEDSICLLIQG